MTLKEWILRITKYNDASPRTRLIVQYLFFVVVAALMWFMLAYSQSVTYRVAVPVDYSVPQGVHLMSRVSDTISVDVRGPGHSFVRYLFMDAPHLKITLDSYRDENTDYFIINEANLKRMLTSLFDNSSINIEHIAPEKIHIPYTEVPGKKVPVVLDANISPNPLYTQSGEILITPDSVLIFGTQERLDQITEVYTNHINATSLTETLHQNITLQRVRNAMIEPRSVDVFVPIEKLVTKTLELPVSVANAPSDTTVVLLPVKVKMIFRVPFSKYHDNAAVSPTAVVNYNDINLLSGSNKIPVKSGVVPGYVQDVRFQPDSVEYIIERRASTLGQAGRSIGRNR